MRQIVPQGANGYFVPSLVSPARGGWGNFLIGELAGMARGKATATRDRARDDAGVRALEQAYDAAWNGRDISALVALFTIDAVLINPRGQVARGRGEVEQVIRGFLDGPARKSSHTSVISDVHFLTADVAIVDGEATLTGVLRPDGATELPLVHRFTDVITRSDGSWSIAHVRAYVYMR